MSCNCHERLFLTLEYSGFVTFAYISVLLYYRSIMKVEEWRAALKDKEVKSLFLDLFNDKIEQCVQSYVAKSVEDISDKFTLKLDALVKKFDDINTNVISLRAEVQRKEGVIEALKAENLQLKGTIESLTVKLDGSEAYQRRENLIFVGLDCRMADRAAASGDALSESSATVTDKVVSFCNDVLKCRVSASDISIAHVLPTKGAGAQSPAVIARFVRRSVRDEVFSARFKLKTYTTAAGGKVYINEDLTATYRKILGILRLKVRNHGITGAWSQSGRILAKDLRGNIKPITTVADAQNFQ